MTDGTVFKQLASRREDEWVNVGVEVAAPPQLASREVDSGVADEVAKTEHLA